MGKTSMPPFGGSSSSSISENFNFTNREVLSQALSSGIINLEEVRELVETMNRNKLEELYQKAKENREVWKGEGSDTRWKFMKPNRVIIAKTKEEDLKQAFFDYHRAKTLEDKRKTMTFGELYLEWIEYQKGKIGPNKGQLSPSTIRRYQRDFERYIEDTPLADEIIFDITSVKIEKFLKEMIITHELTESCLNNVIGYFRGCTFYACKNNLLDKDPCMWVDIKPIKGFCTIKSLPDSDRILTKNEMHKLIDILHYMQEKYERYIQNYAIELATMTGMRVGELAALKWECVLEDVLKIDYSEHRLDYEDKPCEYVIGEPKNRKHREYPMTDDMRLLFARIRKIHEKYGIESKYVFANKQGRVNSHTISCAMSRRCQDAGIENRSIHAIRRTVSSYLRTILPVSTVAAMLGHLEETNEKYYNYDIMENNDKAKCLSSMNEVFKTCQKVA